MRRRDFLQVVSSVSFGVVSGQGSFVPTLFLPLLPRGRQPTLNVRSFGALGDGVADDTAAFARCIGSLGSSGGSVLIPKGIYNIDPLRSVMLVDNLDLRFDEHATLKAIPVRENKSAVIRGVGTRNVSITGGVIIGERTGHLGLGGEWGMGLELRACSTTTIVGLNVTDCWGDGIYVGSLGARDSTAITIRQCRSRGNRRQGLSITSCIGGLVEDCEFSDTNGTPPQCGIDLEPNGSAAVRDVRIVRCLTTNNRGPGIALSGRNVKNVVVQGNQSISNGHEGILVNLAAGSALSANRIENNGRSGIVVSNRALRTAIVANTMSGNGRSRPGEFDNILLDAGVADTFIAQNIFRSDATLDDPTEYDIRINSFDCARTRLSANSFRAPGKNPGGLLDRGTDTRAAASM